MAQLKFIGLFYTFPWQQLELTREACVLLMLACSPLLWSGGTFMWLGGTLKKSSNTLKEKKRKHTKKIF